MLGNMLQPGQTVEDYQARALQDQMNRFNWMFTEPNQRMSQVQQWLQALAPIGVQQGSSAGMSTQQNQNYTSPMQGVIDGASLGNSIGGALSKAKSSK
jgi:hypothetical protein